MHKKEGKKEGQLLCIGKEAIGEAIGCVGVTWEW